MAVRILYLIDGLGVGGAERGLVLTLRFLDRSRFEPEVAILGGDDALAPEISALGVRVRRLGRGLGPRDLLLVPRIAKLLRRERFDLVHTTLAWSSIAGRVAGRLAGTRVVSHITNADPGARIKGEMARGVAARSRVVGYLGGVTGRYLVDRFVAISEASRGNPARALAWSRAKTDVVLRGQDLADLAHRAALDPRPPIGNPGTPSILAVGRLAPQKGHRYLIEAMTMVCKEYPHARLLIAGDGRMRRELQAMASPVVEFLGIREDVPALLARADVFVFPSLWEGQGTALIEAMAVGGPIVATRIPAVEETIQDGVSGILVAPADSKALAGGILRVLADPAAASALSATAAADAARFDIRKTTRRLEDVYDAVLAPTD